MFKALFSNKRIIEPFFIKYTDILLVLFMNNSNNYLKHISLSLEYFLSFLSSFLNLYRYFVKIYWSSN